MRPFAIATGVTLPVGAYDFHTTRIGYIGGQQRPLSGEIVYETGTFYNGDRQSLALNTARVQVTPQVSLEPSFSINWVDLRAGLVHRQGRAHPRHLHRSRRACSSAASCSTTPPSTSFGSNVRFRWEYQPGSELFVVYTDDYNTETLPSADPLRNRALVVKFNRLFRP